MLLAIDVGNTQTVLGVFDGDRLVAHWRLATQAGRTVDEYTLAILGVLGLGGIATESLLGAAVASAVPPATAMLRDIGDRLAGGPTVVVEPGIRTGIQIVIDNPREIGADRVANSLAALERYGAPAVVVDFGTSTNFDVVSADGHLVGAVIAPGLQISHDALIGNTAALRRVELVAPESVVGKNTVAAIQSGLVFGHAGLVDGLIERLVAEVGAGAHVIATGGLAATIVPHCRTVETIDEFLTLEGLRLLFERNME
jgi:type III pantothenate kinase